MADNDRRDSAPKPQTQPEPVQHKPAKVEEGLVPAYGDKAYKPPKDRHR